MTTLLRKYLSEQTEKWLETLVITVSILAIGFYFNRQDPFFLEADFPWLLFAPLLLALRYGLAAGMTSMALICILCLVMIRTGMLGGEFPAVFMMGGVMMTMICGQFSNMWDTRLRRSDQISRHASERFEQLSRAYFTVRLSHDRLEQNLISRPVTLRDAMLDLRRLLAAHDGRLDQETGAALISILIHYCSMESAAIYLMSSNGQLEDVPVAKCGRSAPCQQDDVLLRSAIETGNTAYQSINRLVRDENTPYLVAAPLRTSTGTLLGVLLVTEMPFLSLHRETLQIMGVLLAYAADHAEAAKSANALLAIYPDCPPMFAAELFKMTRLRRDLDVNSALVMVSVRPNVRMHELCALLERQQRGLDHAWRRDLGWGVQFVTLMPFAAPTAIEGYLARLNDVLLHDFGVKLGDGAITARSLVVAADDPVSQLADLLADEA